MLRLVLTQFAVTLCVAAVAGLIGGGNALLSSLLGGLCCVLPNGFFALRIANSARSPEALTPMTFMFGEFTKIVMTIAMLAAIVWLYRDVNWLALIAAFIIALKSYLILLIRH
jgi:ATP synthase protein I